MLDLGFRKFVAVVRVMHKELVLVEQDTKTGAMAGFNRGAQMGQQGFHLAPLDVAADRVAKNRFENIPVLMAHGLILPLIVPDILAP